MQDRAWREMPNADYAAACIGSMMMSEANIDTISDAIEASKARKAAADRPSAPVQMALDKFVGERDMVLALCERLSAAQKTVTASWDTLLMGLDRDMLEPAPINATSLDMTGTLCRQTSEE